MKQWREIYKNILLLTQLGLSFIMPILLCLVLCWLLTDKAGFGDWIYILGIFFGIGGAAMTAYKFYLLVLRQEEKEDKKKKKRVSYNRHL